MARIAACWHLARAIIRLSRERRGGLALTFALSALPLIGMIGLGADFAFCNQAKAQLDLAADAAAMQATTTASAAFVASNPNYLALGKTAGQQWFTTQVGLLKSFVPTAVTPTVTVTQTGGVFTSTVQYSASVTSSFGRMFGTNAYAIGGTAVTTVTTSPYVDIVFLLDNSSSMTIAATPGDVTKLEALTSPSATPLNAQSSVAGWPCAFACHWSATNNDYYGIAKANGIQVRYDVLLAAVQTSIQTMQNLSVTPNQIGASIYTFNTSLTQVYPTTGSSRGTDLAAALAAAKATTTPLSNHSPNTYFPTIMAQLAANAPPAGDGSTTSAPKKALIIVTDGIIDNAPTQVIPTTEGPISPSDCAAIKAKGYDVYVLYTTYQATSDILLFGNIGLQPYLLGTNGGTPPIIQNLTACASSASNFQKADNSTQIASAMQTLVLSALKASSRISQ